MTTQSNPVRSIRKAIADMSGTVDRLTELSRAKYQNPYRTVRWPDELDPAGQWCFTPELSTLYGTDAWPADDPAVRRLTFQEAVNFFSLNIHGEKALMEGLARRLYRPDLADVADYLHHFLDEENKHSVYFGGFCQRYAKIYRSRHVAFADSTDRAVSDLLFFTKVLIFEEHADRYNVLQSRDDRLHPLALFINEAHHADESRHLVFNRAIVKAFWDVYSPDWTEEQRADIRARVGQFIVMTWREYYNPDVYADCGYHEPWDTAELAWHSPHQREHRRGVSGKCLKFLFSTGLLSEEPADAF